MSKPGDVPVSAAEQQQRKYLVDSTKYLQDTVEPIRRRFENSALKLAAEKRGRAADDANLVTQGQAGKERVALNNSGPVSQYGTYSGLSKINNRLSTARAVGEADLTTRADAEYVSGLSKIAARGAGLQTRALQTQGQAADIGAQRNVNIARDHSNKVASQMQVLGLAGSVVGSMGSGSRSTSTGKDGVLRTSAEPSAFGENPNLSLAGGGAPSVSDGLRFSANDSPAWTWYGSGGGSEGIQTSPLHRYALVDPQPISGG